ncbi:MAG: DNA integrity scanning protein DisA nucleotide-binding domain protein [Chloroflexota bacterium]
MDESVDLLRDLGIDEEVVSRETLELVISLGVEIAREGRNVGTMFVVSDVEETLKRSKTLILDPLWHHPASVKNVRDPDMRETVKELAQLDGAFLVSNEGVVLSACRYINASSEGIDLPLGLGSRHMAGASISKETGAVAVVVSEAALVRVFVGGDLAAQIVPELWLLREYGLHVKEPYSVRSDETMTVACPARDTEGE